MVRENKNLLTGYKKIPKASNFPDYRIPILSTSWKREGKVLRDQKTDPDSQEVMKEIMLSGIHPSLSLLTGALHGYKWFPLPFPFSFKRWPRKWCLKEKIFDPVKTSGHKVWSYISWCTPGIKDFIYKRSCFLFLGLVMLVWKRSVFLAVIWPWQIEPSNQAMEERVPVTDKHSRWNGKLALENGILVTKSQKWIHKMCYN